jgi:hypothetical protein
MQFHNVDVLVDRFVKAINRAVRQRIREEDIPVQLRRGGARFGLYYSWNIQRFEHIHWIAAVEKKLPKPLPPSYRSLVTRYIFPAFEVPPLILLGNTGHALYNEMSYVIFRGKVVSGSLLAAGFVQFARPNTGDYDPICFDLNRRDSQGECPVVRISYQHALLANKPKVISELSPSFAIFVERFLELQPVASTL